MTRPALSAAALLLAVALPGQRFEWREIQPSSRPPGRSDHAMAYDPVHGVTVLFGGRAEVGGSPIAFNDTWIFDGATWTEMQPLNSPAPRAWHSMVWDANRQRIVVLGGAPPNGSETEDVWEWDGTDWTRVGPPRLTVLSTRGRCAFDPVLGGIFYTEPQSGGVNAVWDGVRLRYLSPQQRVFGQGRPVLAHNPVLGGTVGYEHVSGMIRRFDRVAGWVDVFPGPDPRPFDVGMACDPMTGRMVLVGGSGFGRAARSTWISSGAGWADLTQSIPRRSATAISFDSSRGVFVMFGGFADELVQDFYRDDTWELIVIDGPARHETFGQGCGSPAPTLGADPLFGARPVIGGLLTVRGENFVTGQPVWHVLGDSRSSWSGTPLPLDLGGLGAAGCSLLVSVEVVQPLGAADGAGVCRSYLRIPDEVALVGQSFFHQMVGSAPGQNRLGLIVSNGGIGVLGTR